VIQAARKTKNKYEEIVEGDLREEMWAQQNVESWESNLRVMFQSATWIIEKQIQIENNHN